MVVNVAGSGMCELTNQRGGPQSCSSGRREKRDVVFFSIKARKTVLVLTPNKINNLEMSTESLKPVFMMLLSGPILIYLFIFHLTSSF